MDQAARMFETHTWAQEMFMRSDAPEILYTGPLGSLKSRTLTEKADLRCRKHAGARVVLARKKRVDLGLTTLRTLLDYTIDPVHRERGWRPGAEGGATLFYENGSQILCVGMDDPGKMLSAEFDMVMIDQAEQLTEEEWKAASGRLRHTPRMAEGGEYAYRQIGGACNPSDEGHFLFRWFRPDMGSHRVSAELPTSLPTGEILPPGRTLRDCIVADPRDGRDLLPPDYLARLEGFKGRYYDRYVLGKWISFEGSIYGDIWSSNVHVVARPATWPNGYPPLSWPRYRAIDFGYTNPFVCQWWAQDPEGVFWRYREIYMTGRTIAQHKRVMVQEERRELRFLTEGLKPPVPQFLPWAMSVSDHDAGDRALLEDPEDSTGAMIITTEADKDVRAGIQTVYGLLAPYPGPAGAPLSRLRFVRGARLEVDERLVANDRPTCTEEEIPRYKFQRHMESVTGNQEREDPFKQDDHGCDAMRYLFHTMKMAATGESWAV